jgi:hypothetical protein
VQTIETPERNDTMKNESNYSALADDAPDQYRER